MLERRDEGETDRLTCDRHCGGIGVTEHERVGHRLDPCDLRKRIQVVCNGLTRRPEVHRTSAALPSAQHVEADVRGDAVEPGAEGRAAFETVDSAPGADERLLHGVLGLERGAEHPIGVGGQLDPVLLELPFELGGVGPGGERRVLHGAHGTGSRPRYGSDEFSGVVNEAAATR